MGYHLTEIDRGKYGEVSKIQEELDELKDAIKQSNKIMALVELSDIIGAIQGYLTKYHPHISLQDLQTMSAATDRAFSDGTRQSRD